MSETPDKRRRTDLDLFVLALIDGGVSTPYELQKLAGLSQGATIPALQRLLEARFVRQGKRGARGRTDYKVTAAGRKLLETGWLSLVDAGPSGDIDADLRVALLTIWASGDSRLAMEFLRESADRKKALQATAEPTGDTSTVPPLARWYVEMRAGAAKAVLSAESNALCKTAKALPRKLTGKLKRSSRPPLGRKAS
jgi:DNA-binding PadR family transcriptional regulator